MTDILVTLEGRSLREAVEHCLSTALDHSSAGEQQVCVWLSGALARPFMFGPVAGLRGWREAHMAAQAAASAADEFDGPCTVSLEDDPGQQTVLATAVARDTLDSIYEIATSLRVRVRSIRPAWAHAIDTAPDAHARATMLVCRDPDALTVLAMKGDSYVFAATHMPCPDEAQAGALIRRLRLSLNQQDDAIAAVVVGTPEGRTAVAWRGNPAARP